MPASVGRDKGVTDPPPAVVTARPVATPYHAGQPVAGKVFFDSPQGAMVCSGTVGRGPGTPGEVRPGVDRGALRAPRQAEGGWYRNIAFVPVVQRQRRGRRGARTAPDEGTGRAVRRVVGGRGADLGPVDRHGREETGGSGSPYDYAVLHVKPEDGSGKSLQETVGGAVPVWFNAPSASALSSLTAFGYPAAPPFDGQKMYDCPARPGRLSLTGGTPTEYRIGCTMTPGSSGGGWLTRKPDGKLALVSNTSIGPQSSTWLAGPYLGAVAQGVFDALEKKISQSHRFSSPMDDKNPAARRTRNGKGPLHRYCGGAALRAPSHRYVARPERSSALHGRRRVRRQLGGQVGVHPGGQQRAVGGVLLAQHLAVLRGRGRPGRRACTGTSASTSTAGRGSSLVDEREQLVDALAGAGGDHDRVRLVAQQPLRAPAGRPRRPC